MMRKCNPPPRYLQQRKRNAGNIFFMLFAAVALVGAFGVGASNMLKGLVASMSDVTRKTVAEERMTTAARIAFQYQAENAPAGGDCDADSPIGTAPLLFNFIEPIPTRDAGTLPKPTNGGLVPLDIGLNTMDPWGTQYGYCAWDPGDAQCADSIAPRRLAGSSDPTKTVVAVISAGRDRRFSTTCNAYPNTEAVTRAAGGDDIVMEFTYNDVRGMGGEDLWKVKDTNPDTATIEKNIEVGGGGTFTDAINLMQKGLILPTEVEAGACTPAKEGQLQMDTTTSPFTLKMCQGSVWKAVGMGAVVSDAVPVSPEGYMPPDGGLLAWWLFDETSGTTSDDISSNDLNGTLSGTTSFATGKFGNSVDFTSGGKMSPGAKTALDNKIKTACAWVDLSSTGSNLWLWRKSDGTAIGSQLSISSGQGAGGTDNIAFSFNGAGGAVNDFYDIETGWHFICTTWDGGTVSSSAKLYVDGVDARHVTSISSPSIGAPASDAAEVFYAGANSSNGSALNGLADDLMLYDRALEPYEIGNLYYGPVTGSSAPYDSALVAYYKFDDGAGTVAADSSGNGRDAVLSGFNTATAWTTGRSGKALIFDGVNDVVNAGSSAGLDNLSTPTVCAWVKAASTNPASTIVEKGGSAASGWRLSTSAVSGDPKAFTVSMKDPTSVTGAAPNVFAAVWQHVCASANPVNVWRNGVKVSGPVSGGVGNDGPYDLLIGASAGGSYLSGQIDDVQIYNRTLTDIEVSAIYATGGALPKGGITFRDGSSTGGENRTTTSIEPSANVVVAINKYSGKLSVGDRSSCLIKEDNTAWCWGKDDYQQLGNGLILSGDQQSPTRVNDFGPYISIETSAEASCSLKGDGTVWCWGTESGQMGTGGAMGTAYDTPTQAAGTNRFAQISMSNSQTCGVRNDGRVLCWGGSFPNTPTNISDGDTFIKIAGGYNHFCGIKSNGSLWCWGAGGSGQLGDNTTTASAANAVHVAESGPWIDVAGGSTFSCAVKFDGTLWCWGTETMGSLGNSVLSGTFSTPQKSLDRGPWIQVSARQNSNTACGIKVDGTAWCWGQAVSLGNGSALNYSYPVRVLDPGPWANISVGTSSACGMKTDGSFWCWGNDTYGMLGNGSSENDKNVPFKIITQSDKQLATWDANQSALTLAGTANIAMDNKVIQYGENTTFTPANGLAFASAGVTTLNQTVTPTSDSSLPIISGLIGYWPLDGVSDKGGTLYVDDKINNIRGTLNGGPIFVPAIKGNGLQFDGVDDYVGFGSNAILNNTIQSVCMWVQYDNQPSTLTTLVSKGNDTTAGFRLYAGDGAVGDLGVFSDGSYGVNNAAMPVREWHHICGVWPGTSFATYAFKIYKDGVLLSQTATVGTGVHASDAALNLRFGATLAGAGFFKGIMDDIMIFNRDLSTSEVQKLYAGTATPGVDVAVQADVSGSSSSTQVTWTAPPSIASMIGIDHATGSLDVARYTLTGVNTLWAHDPSLVNNLEINKEGYVGIGTTSPLVSRLEVTGGLRVGADTTECVVLRAGALRYTNSGGYFYCNGTAWVAF